MYYNKKRTKTIVLLGVILLLGVCGCNTEETKQKEQKQEKTAEAVTEAVGKEQAETTNAVAEKEEEGTDRGTESIEEVEAQPTENVETEPTDVPQETEPEELVLHVLTNAEEVYFTSGGVGVTELLAYEEEKDVAYFIMKKQKGLEDIEPRSEEVYVGVLNPQTGELLQYYCYGNTAADAVMIEKETGLYIVYATECRDFGLHSGYGGTLLAKDGTLTQIWPLTPEGTYDDDYWNGHTARLNGETLERYKVIVTEVSPGDTAICTEAELEQTITLDEILAGAV